MKNKILAFVILLPIIILGVLFAEKGELPEVNKSFNQGVLNTVATNFENKVNYTSSQIDLGFKAKQKEFESQNPEYPDNGGEKILYEISKEGFISPELHPADAKLWDLVKTLAPNESIFDSIVVFEIYFDEDDTALASVESQDDTNSTWLYSINYTSVEDFEELGSTIVHEYAHILGLQNNQTITEAEVPDIRVTCPNYLVEEGCLDSGSYLNKYFNSFWKNDPDFLGDKDRPFDETEAFYATRPNDYVSEYATTNPVEDFAESFMFYVVKDPVLGGDLKTQKVQFFEQYQELKNYRSKVRSVVSSWATN